jgi:hypothetical protein
MVWNEIFQALKENNFKHRVLYPAKLSFIIEGEIKTFHNKQKVDDHEISTPEDTQRNLTQR